MTPPAAAEIPNGSHLSHRTYLKPHILDGPRKSLTTTALDGESQTVQARQYSVLMDGRQPYGVESRDPPRRVNFGFVPPLTVRSWFFRFSDSDD